MLKIAFLLFCLAAVSVGEKPSVITLPLHRMHTRPEPGDYNGTDIKIISYEEAKGRGLAEIEKKIFNYQNLQYFSTLYIGENRKEMTFIYDTGSTYLWVPLSNCTGCHTTNLYTPASSFTTANQNDFIQYGAGRVEGVIAEDVISVTADTPLIRTSKLELPDVRNFSM